MNRRLTAAATGGMALLLAACGIFIHKVEHYESPSVSPTSFDSIAVIAGNDEQGILQMARQIRERIEADSIVAVVHVSGLWQTELDAVEGICQQFKVQGVVVVVWNRVTLRECEQMTVAFDMQGGYTGGERMTDALLKYLHRGRT